MSSSFSGYHLKSGADPHTYSSIGAILSINSQQEDGAEFWWALVPDRENLDPSGLTAIYVTLDITGKSTDAFSWASPPATVGSELEPYVDILDVNEGKCRIVFNNAPTGIRADFTLHIEVDGDVVDLDPEVDIGMPGAH